MVRLVECGKKRAPHRSLLAESLHQNFIENIAGRLIRRSLWCLSSGRAGAQPRELYPQSLSRIKVVPSLVTAVQHGEQNPDT